MQCALHRPPKASKKLAPWKRGEEGGSLLGAGLLSAELDFDEFESIRFAPFSIKEEL